MFIGKNIARLRKEKGLTQAELGNMLGVSNQAVSKWESETTMPDIMLLPKIATTFRVTIEDLYRENDEQVFDVEKPSKGVSRGSVRNDKKVLLISVENKEAAVKTRVPVEAVRLLLNSKEVMGAADMEQNALAAFNETLDSDGILVDVNKNGEKVKIAIEEYEA